jgi:Arc/MetJ family transcription regulator
MQSHVDVDTDLLERAKSVTGLGTERAVVEAGLRLLLQLNAQERFRELRGKVKCEEALEESRGSRLLEGQE